MEPNRGLPGLGVSGGGISACLLFVVVSTVPFCVVDLESHGLVDLGEGLDAEGLAKVARDA